MEIYLHSKTTTPYGVRQILKPSLKETVPLKVVQKNMTKRNERTNRIQLQILITKAPLEQVQVVQLGYLIVSFNLITSDSIR